MRVRPWMYLAMIPVVVICSLGIGFWMAKQGSPQDMWLFCHMLQLCAE